MDVLEHIKVLRDERGWSNYRLARESGISDTTLNNLFRLNHFPTIPTLEAICAGFGISLSHFFAEEGEAVVLSEEQQKMLSAWNTLTDKQKTALLELLNPD